MTTSKDITMNDIPGISTGTTKTEPTAEVSPAAVPTVVPATPPAGAAPTNGAPAEAPAVTPAEAPAVAPADAFAAAPAATPMIPPPVTDDKGLVLGPAETTGDDGPFPPICGQMDRAKKRKCVKEPGHTDKHWYGKKGEEHWVIPEGASLEDEHNVASATGNEDITPSNEAPVVDPIVQPKPAPAPAPVATPVTTAPAAPAEAPVVVTVPVGKAAESELLKAVTAYKMNIAGQLQNLMALEELIVQQPELVAKLAKAMSSVLPCNPQG